MLGRARISHRFRTAILAASTMAATISGSSTAHSEEPVGVSATAVDWKLVFNEIFASEIRKEVLATTPAAQVDGQVQGLLREHTNYTPSTFNETLRKVLAVSTTNEAFETRRKHYGDPSNYERIAKWDLSSNIPSAVRQNPSVARLLSTLEAGRNRPISAQENYFDSAEGKAMMDAMGVGAQGPGSQEVALVLIPGYAGHTIKFEIFPEILADANRHWGRPDSRPLLSENLTVDLTFEDHRSFYGRNTPGTKPFDILHPAGKELGNSVGYNKDTADLMADWIKNLPPEYAKKKLILLGYSKGAPVVFEMLERHPELKPRVMGLVTYAGVIQGTHIARSALDDVRAYLGKKSIGQFIDEARAKGQESLVYAIAPFLQGVNLSFMKLPKIQQALSVLGKDASDLQAQTDRLLYGQEIRALADGLEDLSPYTRTAWNLRHLDNSLVGDDTFLFNLSAVTDIKSFARPTGFDAAGHRRPNIIAPKILPTGKIDWKNFSLDGLFLYLSSVQGFRQAPGGLYDTQVELQHTKSPWLDSSPLSASLTDGELAQLWNTPDIRARLTEAGVTSLETFKTTPRQQLLAPQRTSHLKSVDLGEINGHHWSLFLQAFRPPASEGPTFYSWPFPRKPYMRALLQTMALYNVVSNAAGTASPR